LDFRAKPDSITSVADEGSNMSLGQWLLVEASVFHCYALTDPSNHTVPDVLIAHSVSSFTFRHACNIAIHD